MPKTLLIAGLPSSGKTTLFTGLTGVFPASDPQHPGKEHEATCNVEGTTFHVVDMPGNPRDLSAALSRRLAGASAVIVVVSGIPSTLENEQKLVEKIVSAQVYGTKKVFVFYRKQPENSQPPVPVPVVPKLKCYAKRTVHILVQFPEKILSIINKHVS